MIIPCILSDVLLPSDNQILHNKEQQRIQKKKHGDGWKVGGGKQLEYHADRDV